MFGITAYEWSFVMVSYDTISYHTILSSDRCETNEGIVVERILIIKRSERCWGPKSSFCLGIIRSSSLLKIAVEYDMK